MSEARGLLEATILLNKSTCYFMKTGRCSLDMIDDFSMLPAVKSAPSDLLYCPRLLKMMQNARKSQKESTVKCKACECGHAEIVSHPQKACIASQKKLLLHLEMEDVSEPLCPVCGRQMTFEEESAMNQGGARIVSIQAGIRKKEVEG